MVILLTALVLGGTVRQLAIPMALLVVVWALAWWRVRRGYVKELGRNLRRMNLIPHREAGSAARGQPAARDTERLLDSPYERAVLQGIDMLEENDPGTLSPRLEGLLAHGSGRVRAQALRYVRHHRIDGFTERIEQMIHDDDPEVQVQALALLELSRTERFGSIHDYLDSPDPRVRKAAILCVAEQSAASDAEVVATPRRPARVSGARDPRRGSRGDRTAPRVERRARPAHAAAVRSQHDRAERRAAQRRIVGTAPATSPR